MLVLDGKSQSKQLLCSKSTTLRKQERLVDYQPIYMSLGNELLSMKDRVRQLIGDRHWQTDGEWKESVLRNVISRYLPGQILMQRGFVIDFDTNFRSGQVDILFTDSRWPPLFSDNDLAIVKLWAVRGLVEVKTKISPHTVTKALQKLLRDSAGVCFPGTGRLFALFAYSHDMGDSAHEILLDKLHATATGNTMNVISTVVAGPDLIIRYVEFEDGAYRNEWRAYRVEGEAFGYFIAIVLRSLIGEEGLWLPHELSSERCIATRSLT
jgi:hypothetical protein